MTMFKRIAVVNRGEAAVRLIRAVRELNAEHDYGIRVIALHTEAERRAMFVRQADEGVTLRSTGTGSPYLDYAELERALLAAKADAVWVGWGFVAEDPAFAEIVAKLGITFIGPSADAMRLLGDKVAAKILAEKVGVPVAPWSGRTGRNARRRSSSCSVHRISPDHQGPKRRRRTRYPQGLGRRRTRSCTRAHAGRSRAVLRRPRRLPRTPCHRCTPRRGTGHRRQPRQCLGSGRSRLLDSASQPEGHRRILLPPS